MNTVPWPIVRRMASIVRCGRLLKRGWVVGCPRLMLRYTFLKPGQAKYRQVKAKMAKMIFSASVSIFNTSQLPV